MKLDEIKDAKVSVVIQMDKKSLTISATRIEIDESVLSALKLPNGVCAIVTEVLKSEGKVVSLDSSAIAVHIQKVIDGKVLRFSDVKHRRITVGGNGCECFYTAKEAMKIEQRKAFRLGISMPGQVAKADETSAGNATVKDISMTGAGLLSTTLQLDLGETVGIRFSDRISSKGEGEPEKFDINLSAQVVRLRELGKFTEYGLRITSCNANALSKYISTKQRMQIKKE